MAIQKFVATPGPASAIVTYDTDGTAASITALDVLIAAAQAIGAGDASAEIDAIDAAVVANSPAAGNVVVTVDTAVVTTLTRLRRALDEVYEKARQYPGLFAP